MSVSVRVVEVGVAVVSVPEFLLEPGRVAGYARRQRPTHALHAAAVLDALDCVVLRLVPVQELPG